MQLSKNISIFFIFILITMLTACKQGSSAMMGEDNAFRVHNVNNITKIFIADKEGASVTLNRNGNKWTVNDKYDVRKSAIEVLLNTLKDVRVRYSVDTAALKNMQHYLATDGIKVEIYENGYLSKTFYVGDNTPKQDGTILYMEGYERPYITHIANWDGVLRPRFMTGLDDWRDRSLVAYPQGTVAEVSVEYAGNKDQSFKLTASGSKYEVKPFFQSTATTATPLMAANAKTFLTGLEHIMAEDFDNTNENKDSIVRSAPFCTVSIKNTSNITQTLAFYPMLGRMTDDDGSGNIGRAAVDHYFVYVDKKEVMVAQHAHVKVLFWGYKFFFEPLNKQNADPKGNIKRKY